MAKTPELDLFQVFRGRIKVKKTGPRGVGKIDPSSVKSKAEAAATSLQTSQRLRELGIVSPFEEDASMLPYLVVGGAVVVGGVVLTGLAAIAFLASR